MINLFVCIYPELDRARQNELLSCLQYNLDNAKIDRVFLIEEPKTNIEVEAKKSEVIKVKTRPSFAQIFEIINAKTKDNDINIIANSDIFFDEHSISNLRFIQQNECYALTRWDVETDKTATFMNRRDSQDTWVFKGRIKPIDANFNMGVPGCDNAIAYKIQQAGYIIKNPSISVKTFHLHADESRQWHGTEPIQPPYLLLEPSQL